MRLAGRRRTLVLLPLALAGLAAAPARAPQMVRAADEAVLQLRGTAVQGGLIAGRVPGGTVSLTLDGKPVRFAPDGAFIIGFGRDAASSALIEARLPGGMPVSHTIMVATRSWSIQSLPTLPRGTAPTPAFLARRQIELAQIDAARAIASDSEGWRQHFIWPARGRVSGVFGSQRIYAGEPGAPHGGVDVAKPTGAVVIAPADGVVVLAAAAPFTLEGNLLMIDHGMGLNSAFLHLSRIDVKPGEHVRQGQPIGAVGMTGRATGPHLHWGMKWQDERIDPASLTGPMTPG